MNEQQAKQRAFLYEEVHHFKLSNRGIKPGCKHLCTYVDGCAIGRKIADMKLREELDSMCASVASPRVFEKLPGDLQELGQNFLQAAQNLHDVAGNWDNDGLSETGKRNAGLMCSIFGLEPV